MGDIILAINNVSLRGKSLTEAIELLQNADDMVTLKISRKLERAIRIEDYAQKSQQHTKSGHSFSQLNTHQAFRVPVNKSQSYINNNNNNEKEDEIDSYKSSNNNINNSNNNASNFIGENSDSINSNENNNQKSLHYRTFFF